MLFKTIHFSSFLQVTPRVMSNLVRMLKACVIYVIYVLLYFIECINCKALRTVCISAV